MVGCQNNLPNNKVEVEGRPLYGPLFLGNFSSSFTIRILIMGFQHYLEAGI